ncbi:hypothetical protein HZA57_03365 [Candidatus Poribacteria bacterium]|nr:hypothetical protein [Candidatus Poribacteria bacterium]
MFHKRVRSSLLALAVMGTATLGAQPPKAPVPAAPEPLSAKVAEAVADPLTKLGTDRFTSDLRVLDVTTQVARSHAARLRASLATGPSEPVQAELDRYKAVLVSLEGLTHSLRVAQSALGQCKASLLEMESAASGERVAPSAVRDSAIVSAAAARSAAAQLSEGLEALRAQAAALPDDPNLPRTVATVESAIKALSRAVELCDKALPRMG